MKWRPACCMKRCRRASFVLHSWIFLLTFAVETRGDVFADIQGGIFPPCGLSEGTACKSLTHLLENVVTNGQIVRIAPGEYPICNATISSTVHRLTITSYDAAEPPRVGSVECSGYSVSVDYTGVFPVPGVGVSMALRNVRMRSPLAVSLTVQNIGTVVNPSTPMNIEIEDCEMSGDFRVRFLPGIVRGYFSVSISNSTFANQGRVQVWNLPPWLGRAFFELQSCTGALLGFLVDDIVVPVSNETEILSFRGRNCESGGIAFDSLQTAAHNISLEFEDVHDFDFCFAPVMGLLNGKTSFSVTGLSSSFSDFKLTTPDTFRLELEEFFVYITDCVFMNSSQFIFKNFVPVNGGLAPRVSFVRVAFADSLSFTLVPSWTPGHLLSYNNPVVLLQDSIFNETVEMILSWGLSALGVNETFPELLRVLGCSNGAEQSRLSTKTKIGNLSLVHSGGFFVTVILLPDALGPALPDRACSVSVLFANSSFQSIVELRVSLATSFENAVNFPMLFADFLECNFSVADSGAVSVAAVGDGFLDTRFQYCNFSCESLQNSGEKAAFAGSAVELYSTVNCPLSNATVDAACVVLRVFDCRLTGFSAIQGAGISVVGANDNLFVVRPGYEDRSFLVGMCVERSVFTNCRSINSGGFIYAFGSGTFSVQNCTFNSGQCSLSGGVFALFGTANVSLCGNVGSGVAPSGGIGVVYLISSEYVTVASMFSCSLVVGGNEWTFVRPVDTSGSDNSMLRYTLSCTHTPKTSMQERHVCPAGSLYRVAHSVNSIFGVGEETSISCEECGRGSVLLEETGSWKGSAQSCHDCPGVVDCPGGAVYRARPGFWPIAYRPVVEEEESAQALASYKVVDAVECPIGYCCANDARCSDSPCAEHRDGFLCSSCASSWCLTLSATCVRCSECSPTRFVISNVFGSMFWVGFVWLQPGQDASFKTLAYFAQMLPYVSFPWSVVKSGGRKVVAEVVGGATDLFSLRFLHGADSCPFEGMTMAGVIAMAFLSPVLYIGVLCVIIVIHYTLSMPFSPLWWLIRALAQAFRLLGVRLCNAALVRLGLSASKSASKNASESASVRVTDDAESADGDTMRVGLPTVCLINPEAVEGKEEANESVKEDVDDAEVDIDEENVDVQRGREGALLRQRTRGGMICADAVLWARRVPRKPWNWSWMFSKRYTLALTTFVLLAYPTYVETSFRLLHCRRFIVDSEDNKQSRLFEDASSVRCWMWWQYLVWVFTILVLLPFPFALLYLQFALRGWRAAKHGFTRVVRRSTTAAVSAARTRTSRSLPCDDGVLLLEDGGLGVKQQAVLDVLSAPYGRYTKWWETVNLLRRVCILLCFCFSDNAYTRTVMIATLCFLFFALHVMVLPFAKRSDNLFEGTALFVLMYLAFLKMRAAVLISTGSSLDSSSTDSVFWVEFVAGTLLFAIVYSKAAREYVLFIPRRCLRVCRSAIRRLYVLQKLIRMRLRMRRAAHKGEV